MNKDNSEGKYRCTYLAATVFAVLVFYVLINFEETHKLVCDVWQRNKELRTNSCAWNYFKEFQTLAGGILAIFAAVITVLQMQASERKSDERNRQTLRATTLEERKQVMALYFKIERAWYLSDEAMQNRWKEYCGKNIHSLDNDEFYQICYKMEKDFHAIADEIDHEDVKKIEILFSGVLRQQISQIRSTMGGLFGRKCRYDEESAESAIIHFKKLNDELNKFRPAVAEWVNLNLRTMGDDTNEVASPEK